MKNLVLAALPLAMAAAGCATITRGAHQAFTVETEPSGAHVSTSLGLTCDATPCTFPHVSREAEFALGGLIGTAVDANSGATQDLVPNPLRVTLEAEGAPAAAEAAPAAAASETATDTTAAPEAGAAPAELQAAPATPAH